MFLLTLIISGAVGIQDKLKETKYTISVSGEGKVFVKPDIAKVSVSVFTESKKLTDVQQENTQKMNAIINFLKNDLGILEKDLKTTGYTIYPQYDYTKDGTRIFLGYKITQTLEIKIRDLGKVGDVLEGAVAKGANEIGSLQFANEDLEKIKVEARKLAIENAKEKAKTLSSQLGVGLGRVVSFNENFYTPWPTPYPLLKEAAGIGGGGVPQIETGENEIIVDVSITYEIK